MIATTQGRAIERISFCVFFRQKIGVDAPLKKKIIKKNLQNHILHEAAFVWVISTEV